MLATTERPPVVLGPLSQNEVDTALAWAGRALTKARIQRRSTKGIEAYIDRLLDQRTP